MTEFAVCYGGSGFKPRTTDLQSGALPLSHLSSSILLDIGEYRAIEVTQRTDFSHFIFYTTVYIHALITTKWARYSGQDTGGQKTEGQETCGVHSGQDKGGQVSRWQDTCSRTRTRVSENCRKQEAKPQVSQALLHTWKSRAQPEKKQLGRN
jgi:hypothetical protein